MNSPSLFPILPQQPTGIARMAAEAQHADDGHLVEFKALEVRSILNRSVSKRQLWMAYSINPYRGCEFGCRYCYARYTHEFMAPKAPASAGSDPVGAMPTTAVKPASATAVDLRDPESFERLIFLKQNAAWLLEQELRRIDPALEIALGTATDPYQPIERRARITRSLLEVFSRKTGYRLGIVTKSRLIERDVDLLAEISKRNTLVVHITITTPDANLARLLEPRAPRPDLRFQAVKRLREAGIRTGILCSPLLPGITDSEEALDGMARRAAEAGASFFAASPLFLKPCSRPTYLSFVREHFPALQQDYAKRFGNADFAAPAYSQQMAVMVDRACRKYGLGRRSKDALLPRTGVVERRPLAGEGAMVQQKLFV
ncbi:MAG: Radical domain protein [Edaphobacter sp.]|nr:Radical domain protein [Edaphobacter sp.]